MATLSRLISILLTPSNSLMQAIWFAIIFASLPSHFVRDTFKFVLGIITFTTPPVFFLESSKTQNHRK
jgi:hypothetical protein